MNCSYQHVGWNNLKIIARPDQLLQLFDRVDLIWGF
jgi:hypothetical protein